MSNKNPKYNKPVTKPAQKAKSAVAAPKAVAVEQYPDSLIWGLLAGVLLVTFWCYHYTLGNQFTNWDDGVYIYENPYVKNLSPANLSMILFHDITQNYYHPITMLSLALNYHYSGMNPQPYYIAEIIIHLLNTALVYLLSFSLLTAMVKRGYGKIKFIPYIAGLCALWQGIHPMHVESVSWIAERKDVLYLFFYLAGLIFYVKYVNGEKIPWMKYANIIPIILFLWAASIIKGNTVDWNFHSTIHVSKQVASSSAIHVSESLILYILALLFAAVSIVAFMYKNVKVEIFYVAEMFLFSVTSKPLAVVFPLSLFAIDFLLKRDKDIIIKKVEWLKTLINVTIGIGSDEERKEKFYKWEYIFFRLLIEKLPLLLLSLLLGYIAYYWAKEGGSISSFHTFTVYQRISFSGYNYLMYIFKLFVPTHLCSYYPYPEYLENSTNLPLQYYFMPFLAVLTTIGLILWAYFKSENLFRIVGFGFLFYFFNVMFILQFISAGPAIMAERYTYASYFGFVFMLVYLLYYVWDKIPLLKIPVSAFVVLFSCVLFYLCQARTEVWHNTKTLWKDVITKYPASADTVYNANKSQYVVHTHQGVETAYKNLGNYYVQDLNPPNYDSAYMNYEVLEHINTKDAGVYANLGNIWAIRGNIDKSLQEYTKSLKLDSNSFDTYLNRAITYCKMGQNEMAIKDFDHAFRLDSTNQALFVNRAFTLLNGVHDFKGAVADYNRLIAIDPTKYEYFKNRGVALLNMGKTKEAIDDFGKTLNLSPKEAETMYYMSLAYKDAKSYPEAITYGEKAQQTGYKIPATYLQDLQKLQK